MLVEIPAHLPGEVESGWRDTMTARAGEETTTRIGCTQDRVCRRLVLPIAPEIGRDASAPDSVEMRIDGHFFPEGIAGQIGDAVAIGHPVPELRHRRVR